MDTTTKTNARVSVIDGWAVRDLPNGDQIRARLRVDPDPFDPDREGTGVLLVRERDGYRGIDLDQHDGLSAVLDRFTGDDYWDANPENYGQGAKALPVDREEFVRRYLRAFWDVEDAFLFEHQGYSQSEWADIWVISERPMQGALTTREYAEVIVNEWSDWAKGDCYYVEIENRSLADAMEAEDFEEGWSGFESYGGGIGDDGALNLLHEALYVHPFGGVDVSSLPEPYEVTA